MATFTTTGSFSLLVALSTPKHHYPRHLLLPHSLSLPTKPTQFPLKLTTKPISLKLKPKPKPKPKPLSFSLNPLNPQNPNINPNPIISNSIKTLSTLLTLTLTLTLTTKLTQIINPQNLLTIQHLQDNFLPTVGPLFFATLKHRPPPGYYLTTPALTAIATGMAKWLDIYSGVLMVRVLLSWFPNMPWDRQPFSAIRDLCDPYLSLLRKIVPPVFDTIDISPLFAFTFLGVLASILNTAKLVS